jgi:hypothetical protein
MNMLYKKKIIIYCIGLIIGLGVTGAAVYADYSASHPTLLTDAEMQAISERVSVDMINEAYPKLAAIRQGCADRLKDKPDAAYEDASAFSTFRPLSNYTCGSNDIFSSEIETINLSNGQNVLFVLPLDYCYSPGCGYFAFLQNKDGLVKRISGFDTKSYDFKAQKVIATKDSIGEIFSTDSVVVDNEEHTVTGIVEAGERPEKCGNKNVWTIDTNGKPSLIGSYTDKNCDSKWQFTRIQ